MIHRRLTFANVTSLVALFVALGGTSYAALTLPKGSVGAAQLRPNAVTSSKVKQGTLRLSDFRASQRDDLSGPPGAPGPKGDPGHAGPLSYVTKRAQANLAPPPADTPIASLESLPAGSYLLLAHTTAVNFGSPGYVRCGIRGAGRNSFGAANLIGSATSVGAGQGYSFAAQDVVTLPVTSDQAFSAQFFCRQNNATAAYVEETRLMAIPIGSIDARGDAAG